METDLFLPMALQRFEDIIAWQKAQDLAVDIYRIASGIKDYGFSDQYRTAVISVSNNIAEGFNRESKSDFVRFLIYAKSSCSEVKSMTYLGNRIGHLNTKESNHILGQCNEIQKILGGFIRALRR